MGRGGPLTRTLAEVLATYRPESDGGRKGETWIEHAQFLWAEDSGYMARMVAHMFHAGAWWGPPLVVDGEVVQDGHHRVVAAAGLGWFDLDVPVVPA